MARPERMLSARAVTTTSAPGRYADGGGLYLMISPGRRRWVWQFQWRGKTREMGLGPASHVSLKQARDDRDRWREVLRCGRDPIAEKKQRHEEASPKPAFGECADALLKAREPGWKNKKHVEQWRMTLTAYAAPIRSMPVDRVTTNDIVGILLPMWLKVPETASRLRGRIETVIDAARAEGHIGENVANPARWKGHLEHLLPKQRKSRGHHAAMPYDDVPAFIAELRQAKGVAALALEFAILTAARTTEVIGGRKTEIDRAQKVWTVPLERMKAERPHRVPLSDASLAVLGQIDALGNPGPYIFPGQGSRRSRKRHPPLSNMSMDAVLRRMKVDYTVHGFRSSFRDWAGDETLTQREVIEAALAHVVGDETEQAYRRGEALKKRRVLMDAWAEFCGSDRGDNVVPITARQA